MNKGENEHPTFTTRVARAVVNHIVELELKIESMDDRLKRIEAMLNQDSHNSSKPPSSDINKNYSSTPKKKGSRTSGGQHGHKGSTLKRVAEPDTIVRHTVCECTTCGHSLKTVEAHSIRKRQVIDLPPMTPVVTEHEAESKACPRCGDVTHAVFPPHITKGVQYGSRIKAIACYLLQHQLVPAARTQEFLRDILGCPVSEGSLFAWSEDLVHESAPAYEAIKQLVIASPVIHTDETLRQL